MNKLSKTQLGKAWHWLARLVRCVWWLGPWLGIRRMVHGHYHRRRGMAEGV